MDAGVGSGSCQGLVGMVMVVVMVVVVVVVGVDSSIMTSSSLPPLGESELMAVVKKEPFTVF